MTATSHHTFTDLRVARVEANGAVVMRRRDGGPANLATVAAERAAEEALHLGTPVTYAGANGGVDEAGRQVVTLELCHGACCLGIPETLTAVPDVFVMELGVNGVTRLPEATRLEFPSGRTVLLVAGELVPASWVGVIAGAQRPGSRP